MSKTSDLAKTWQRFDWRESFFAPNAVILQALTTGGTASGVGRGREAAYQRCLGETAEIQALSALPAALRAGFDPLRDGLAAHVEPETARRSARLEAFERRAVARWWLEEVPARPLDDSWLASTGLPGMVTIARLGAALKRRTGWWQIETRPDQPAVMVCRSISPEGQDPVIGYGCATDPVEAAQKALRELFLMEMNLMELLAARRLDLGHPHPAQERIATYARRSPALLPSLPPVTPAATDTAATGSTSECWLGTALTERDITPPDGPIAVWLCQPDLPVPIFNDRTGVPFM
ncbi:YcaO-like family protein [uncultured Paracoccus sp.]|uniref:YcaO-like family protein n=1 Tax=uncultured Paracoccus sp. TaxID=189685 RepID=UPI002607CAF9|nr:YcaO-like family protein [uncultured Paracoccus sp.]